MVNRSDMAEAGHMQALDTCSYLIEKRQCQHAPHNTDVLADTTAVIVPLPHPMDSTTVGV